MIEGQSIVYYGAEPWDSMWRNRQHLLSRMSSVNRVLYLEPRPWSAQVLGGLRSGEIGLADLLRRSDWPVARGPWVSRWPLYVPIGGGPFRPVTRWGRRAYLQHLLQRLDMHSPIVWVSLPNQRDVLGDVPARLRVYHIVDEYLGYYGLPSERREEWAAAEREMIDWADLVVVVSKELMETKGQGDPKFRLLPNAVDIEAYPPGLSVRPVPALVGLPHPILGYIGLVSVRLDLAMLDELVTRHPEWTLVMVGAIYPEGCEVELARLASRPNVLVLPRVPSQEVPDYVRHFDVGLVPYKCTAETQHASPLKLFEYLAAGLPVVSTDVPSARQFASVVTLVASAEEWERAVAVALETRSEEEAARRRQAVAEHTWDARVETLSGYLREALTATGLRDQSAPFALRGARRGVS
jgi:glycosyltransferase involved in cell wall biosynthesis